MQPFHKPIRMPNFSISGMAPAAVQVPSLLLDASLGAYSERTTACNLRSCRLSSRAGMAACSPAGSSFLQRLRKPQPDLG